MDKKDTRGVNVENVIKLIKYLKKEKTPKDIESFIEYTNKNKWTEEHWISYDNKCS